MLSRDQPPTFLDAKDAIAAHMAEDLARSVEPNDFHAV